MRRPQADDVLWRATRTCGTQAEMSIAKPKLEYTMVSENYYKASIQVLLWRILKAA